MQTIIVRYSCVLCGLVDTPVTVPVRRDDQPNVMPWMHETERLVSADHAKRSPDCHPEQLQNLKIPYIAGSKVGRPPTVN